MGQQCSRSTGPSHSSTACRWRRRFRRTDRADRVFSCGAWAERRLLDHPDRRRNTTSASASISREGGWPVWTPDGRTIIVSSARAGSRTLWLIPADGGEPSPLTTGAGDDDQPEISADGRQLAYTNVRNTWDLRVKNLATGEDRTLLQRGVELLFSDVLARWHVAHVPRPIGLCGRDLHDWDRRLGSASADRRSRAQPSAALGLRRPRGVSSFRARRRFRSGACPRSVGQARSFDRGAGTASLHPTSIRRVSSSHISVNARPARQRTSRSTRSFTKFEREGNRLARPRHVHWRMVARWFLGGGLAARRDHRPADGDDSAASRTKSLSGGHDRIHHQVVAARRLALLRAGSRPRHAGALDDRG